MLYIALHSTYFVGCPPPADPTTNRTADRFDYNMQAKDPFLSPLKEYVDFRETIRCVQTLVDNSIYLSPEQAAANAAATTTTTTTTTTTVAKRKKREVFDNEEISLDETSVEAIRSKRSLLTDDPTADCELLKTKVRALLDNCNTNEKFFNQIKDLTLMFGFLA